SMTRAVGASVNFVGGPTATGATSSALNNLSPLNNTNNQILFATAGFGAAGTTPRPAGVTLASQHTPRWSISLPNKTDGSNNSATILPFAQINANPANTFSYVSTDLATIYTQTVGGVPMTGVQALPSSAYYVFSTAGGTLSAPTNALVKITSVAVN